MVGVPLVVVVSSLVLVLVLVLVKVTRVETALQAAQASRIMMRKSLSHLYGRKPMKKSKWIQTLFQHLLRNFVKGS